jgi:hypothetical protein
MAVRAMDRSGTGRLGLQDLADHLAPRAAAQPPAATGAAHVAPAARQLRRRRQRQGGGAPPAPSDAAVLLLRGDVDPLLAETVRRLGAAWSLPSTACGRGRSCPLSLPEPWPQPLS